MCPPLTPPRPRRYRSFYLYMFQVHLFSYSITAGLRLANYPLFMACLLLLVQVEPPDRPLHCLFLELSHTPTHPCWSSLRLVTAPHSSSLWQAALKPYVSLADYGEFSSELGARSQEVFERCIRQTQSRLHTTQKHAW